MPAPVRPPELAGEGGWIGVDRPLSMAALRGRVVLVWFWSASSIESHRLLDELRPIEDLFADDLVVVGVHTPRYPREADHDVVVAAVARHAIAHPVVDDRDGRTWRAYGVRHWPTAVIVGPRGEVYGSVSGDGCRALLEKAVKELVEGAPRPRGGRRRKLPAISRTLLPNGPLAFPSKVACSPDGRRLAVADTANDRVLFCSLDGVVLEAHTGFSRPHGVRFDGTAVVVCDTGADRVVRTDGEVLADSLVSPWDLVGDGRSWVVAEAGGHRLVRVRPGELRARLVAGTGAEGHQDGPVAKAVLSQPSGVARTSTGIVFVDAGTSSLRAVAERGRDADVSTLAGGGAGPLQCPLGVAADPARPGGGPVYVADTYNSALLVWDGATLSALPVAGLDRPEGLDVLPDGRLVVADTGNHRIVVVEPLSGGVEPVDLDETWVHGTDGPPLRLAPGARARVDVALELVDEELDHRPGEEPPVRVTVEARPSSLITGGRREAVLDGASGTVEVVGGAEGAGLLLVEVTARALGAAGPAVRVQRRRHVLDVVR